MILAFTVVTVIFRHTYSELNHNSNVKHRNNIVQIEVDCDWGSDPTTPENLTRITGRGLYLMGRLTDELLFAKNGAKTVMVFFLNKQNAG